MLKSLYSGVTGMKNMQTKMDVISNNIANVNTTSFKAGRVRFEDMISQNIAQSDLNVNPKQAGLGVQVGAVDNVMGAGSLQSTGRELDFAIQEGDNSFFVVSTSGEETNALYTRDGGFYLNANNELTTASGAFVLGRTPAAGTVYDVNADTTSYLGENSAMGKLTIQPTMNGADLQSYAVNSEGVIVGTYSNGDSYVLGVMSLAHFSNPAGLEKMGGNLYANTANSGAVNLGLAGEEGYGSIRSGFLEMSNVDLTNEFTEMIVASRAYQASSRSITTSDQMVEELLSLKR